MTLRVLMLTALLRLTPMPNPRCQRRLRLPVWWNSLLCSMHSKTLPRDKEPYGLELAVKRQHSAAYSFKCLIHACIDKSLIKDGVDQIVNHTNIILDASESHQPSIIEQVCSVIESFLRLQYTAVWDLAFEIVSTMSDKLGEYSSYFMKCTLNRLADMQKLTKKEFQFRKQMHECLGSALVAMGPEKFLGMLPLNLEAKDPIEVNDWLFPILTKYTIGARLSFFMNLVLDMVGIMRKKSEKLRLQGLSSRRTNALVHSLWSLLPSFCNFPSNIVESFKDLVEVWSLLLRKF